MNKSRFFWLLAAGAILALLLWRLTAPPAAPVTATPAAVAGPSPASVLPPLATPAATPPPVTPPVRATAARSQPPEPLPPLAPGVVPIRDQKTIDFSSGKPVVKDDAAEKAAIEAALREMEEATKGVTFGPNSGPPAIQ
jgi:hypothetical protein